MLLQSVRPNIVQSIRAFRPEDLQQAAQDSGQHFLYTNLSEAQSKQDVLDIIAKDFLFPDHFGKNMDALYDCMTDLVHKSGPQPGFVVVLELIPDGVKFDRETRELLLDSFRDAADFWSERKIAFRVFYSIAVSGKESAGNWDRAEVAQNDAPAAAAVVVKPTKVSKNAPQPMTMNLPPMSSAFDTAMLLVA
ncbi:MAG: barnase inhibitor [Leptothrix sp. (in: Bacteria)]|nr:barnase inhibitor [Leptothrix sp. (in: b-proteobacteria)]